MVYPNLCVFQLTQFIFFVHTYNGLIVCEFPPGYNKLVFSIWGCFMSDVCLCVFVRIYLLRSTLT